MNKKVTISLLILSIIVLILGLHGGSEYYFRDFCLHKTLNMFYNFGNPEFFKKPALVCDCEAIGYAIYYFVLKQLNVVSSFSNFVQYFPKNYFVINGHQLSFMLPALIINNMFAILGVIFTFLTSFILCKKNILVAFTSGFLLATSYVWMEVSHYLIVDIPLASLCITTIFFTVYFIQKKDYYTTKELVIIGALSGLTASAKYNGAVILIAPFLTMVFAKNDLKTIIKNLFILLASSLFTFLITNPYIILDFRHFWSDLTYEYDHASIYGHKSTDDDMALYFHFFHSFPNAFGTIPCLLALIGFFLFTFSKDFSKKIKYAFLGFPVFFYIAMSFSILVFIRYILPLVPVFAILAGFALYYAISNFKNKKLFSLAIIIMMSWSLIQNVYYAIHFYNIVGMEDTRVTTKKILKEMHLNTKPYEIFYTDIFSNSYYEDDFLNEFPYLTNDIKSFLYKANNNSIEITPALWLRPSTNNSLFHKYKIAILDNGAFDGYIQIKKSPKYKDLEYQYFMYNPHTKKTLFLPPYEGEMFVVQINIYNRDKSQVPFYKLRADLKYKKRRGSFLELYFHNKSWAEIFYKKCLNRNLDCKLLTKEKAYYYNNFINY